MGIDASQIGQDKPTKTVTEQYDKEHGTYVDTVSKVPMADRSLQNSMPTGADPNPFTLGPLTGGGR